nr:DUF4160 domain-containing protein [Heliorestis convoluta]
MSCLFCFEPSKQLKLVLAWCEIHRDELMKNWENAIIFKKDQISLSGLFVVSFFCLLYFLSDEIGYR